MTDVEQRIREPDTGRRADAAFHARLLDSVSQAVVVTDLDGTISYWNRFAETLYGWSADEVVGRNILVVIHSEKSPEQSEASMSRLAAGEPWMGELLVRRRDGTSFWAEVSETPVFDDGVMAGVIGVSTDITERRQADERDRLLATISSTLQESLDPETTLTRLVTVLVPAVADWCSVALVEDDGSLRRVAVVHADPAKASLASELMRLPLDHGGTSGLPAAIHIGRSMVDFSVRVETWRTTLSNDYIRVHRALGITSQMHVPLVVRGRVIGGIAFIVGDSGRRYTEADLPFVEDVARRAALAIDNARLHHTLRQSEAKHRRLIERIPAATYIEPADVATGATPVSFISPQIERITGYPVEHWQTTPNFSDQIVHPDDREPRMAEIIRTDQTGEPYRLEYRIIHQDGQIVWVLNEAVLVHNDDGLPLYWHGLVTDITTRKQADEALRESERRLRDVVENIPAVTYTNIVGRTTDQSTIDVSSQITSMLGYAPQQLRTWHAWQSCVHPDDRGMITAEAIRTVQTGDPFDVTYRMTTADGRLRWVRDVAVRTKQTEGRQDVWQGFLFDMTDERIAQERTNATLRGALDAIITITSDGKVLDWNPAAETIFGYRHDDAIGRSLVDLIVPGHLRDAHMAALRRYSETGNSSLLGQRVELTARRADGTEFPVELAIIRTESEGTPLFTGFIRDITERKQADEARRDSEAKYRTLVDNIPAVTYIEMIGGVGTVFMSPQVTEMLGHPPEAWVGSPHLAMAITHPDDVERVRAELSRTDETGDPFDIEQRFIKPNGDVVWCRNSAVLQRDADGTPLFWQGFLVDITEPRRLQEQLDHQAFHDALTGLPNRTLFLDRLEHAIRRSVRRPASVAVVFLDIDNFKVVNDSLGHVSGDAMLVEVAARLSRTIREIDTVARLGGDEFTILVEGTGGLGPVLQVAQRVMAALQEPITIGERLVTATASIGIAVGGAGVSAEDVIRDADLAMYTAKGKGKARIAVFNPAMHLEALHRLEIEHELRAAIAGGQLSLRYQPEIVLATGEVFGVEALVRWEHPTAGTRLPADFIAVAEETGLIVPLGAWVLRHACLDAARWLATTELSETFALSVNLSPRQFRDPQLVSVVEAAMTDAGLDPARLILEITESILADEPDQVTETLQQLCDLGLRIAVDDYGTGYSSLGRLRHVPVDFLKIDRTFITEVGRNVADTALVRSMIDLGHALGTQVVAEGVETQEQEALLRELGCDVGQGYLYAKPVPESDIRAFLQRVDDRAFPLSS